MYINNIFIVYDKAGGQTLSRAARLNKGLASETIKAMCHTILLVQAVTKNIHPPFSVPIKWLENLTCPRTNIRLQEFQSLETKIMQKLIDISTMEEYNEVVLEHS